MRSIQDWFEEYAASHRNETNTLIHWICVPTIYFCILGLLMAIPSPDLTDLLTRYLWADLILFSVLFFYIQRSLPIAIGMGLFSLLCYALAIALERHAPWPLWAICVVVFALAWVGQFIGHHIEGARPSFLKDLQFLLIGPAWLLAKLYRRFGIAY